MYRRKARRILVTDAMVRYNDDIRGMFEQLKQKVKTAIDCFKALPVGRKIAYCLGRIIQIIGAVIAGNQSIHAVHAAKEIRKLYEEANGEAKKVAEGSIAPGGEDYARNPSEVEVDMPIKHKNPFARPKDPFAKKDPFERIKSTSREYEYDRSKSITVKGTLFNMLRTNPAFYMPVMKAIGGLVMAIAGTIMETYAKS